MHRASAHTCMQNLILATPSGPPRTSITTVAHPVCACESCAESKRTALAATNILPVATPTMTEYVHACATLQAAMSHRRYSTYHTGCVHPIIRYRSLYYTHAHEHAYDPNTKPFRPEPETTKRASPGSFRACAHDYTCAGQPLPNLRELGDSWYARTLYGTFLITPV